MSILADFKAKYNDEECFAMVAPMDLNGEQLRVQVVSRKTEQELTAFVFATAKEFMDAIPTLFTAAQFKAAILMLFQHEAPEYHDDLHFCTAVKAALETLGIPNYFITHIDFVSTAKLIELNYPLKNEEVVLMVLVGPEHLSVDVYECTENGYKIIEKRMVTVDQDKESAEAVRSKIFQSWNPKRITLSFNDEKNLKAKKYYKTLLKSKKLIVLDKPPRYQVCKITAEISKWLLDKSYIKFHTIPISAMHYDLTIRMGDKYGLLFMLPIDQPLPYTKSVTFSKIYGNTLFFGSGYDEKHSNWSHLSIERSCHHHKLTVSVDAESFPTIEHEPLIVSSVTDLPETLNTKETSAKHPVIGLYESSSVICIKKDDGEYKFMDAWNGQYGKELVIAFDEEQPKFGDDALKLLIEKPSFIVYDFLKIMSMSPDDIKIDEMWPFTVAKDDNNAVVLEFDNYDGSKKAASLSFLMAMVLKEQLKIIKAEIGEEITVLGFGIFALFDDEEMKRVEGHLKETCKLLEIECAIIDC